eukprot:scaffold5550_cov43-Prasinocladus_malaysianus.AAC.2
MDDCPYITHCSENHWVSLRVKYIKIPETLDLFWTSKVAMVSHAHDLISILRLKQVAAAQECAKRSPSLFIRATIEALTKIKNELLAGLANIQRHEIFSADGNRYYVDGSPNKTQAMGALDGAQ